MDYEKAAARSRERWRFAVGQCVDHQSGNMASLVLNRMKASNGLQIYGVRAVGLADPQRDRMMLGECLVRVRPGSNSCTGCRFDDSGKCLATIAAC